MKKTTQHKRQFLTETNAVSYDTALSLKLLGFNEPTLKCYYTSKDSAQDDQLISLITGYVWIREFHLSQNSRFDWNNPPFKLERCDLLSAPDFIEANAWLVDQGVFIHIHPDIEHGEGTQFYYTIDQVKSGNLEKTTYMVYSNYNETAQAAIATAIQLLENC